MARPCQIVSANDKAVVGEPATEIGGTTALRNALDVGA